MDLKRVGHRHTIIEGGSKRYQAAMILSDHETIDEALEAVFVVMNKETDEIMEKETEELRKQGIKAFTVKELTKDMTPEQIENFKKERFEKFIRPLLDKNIEELEQKGRSLTIKRIK